MMKFLRSQSQTVLVVVLGFIAVGFLFYGNAGNLLTSGTAHANNDYGRIDGTDLSVADLYDTVRDTKNTLRIFGQGAQLQQPGAQAGVAELAWEQLLLKHEADRLHINITPGEIADWIKKQPVFQKNGAFSLDAYNDQMKNYQMELHITPDAGADPVAATKALFENIIRDYLRTEAVKHALFDSIRSSAHDVKDQFANMYGPTTVTYVTFDPKDYLAQVKVTPADIEAEYKKNPTNPAYRTSEKRKVDYVLYSLTPDQAKLPADQKQAAKDALGQKALDFALAFQPDPSAAPGTPAPNVDFTAEAKKRGLTPLTTDFFGADQTPTGLPPSPAFNQAAFGLSKDQTISKVVEMDNGVAVLHLAEIQPSQLRPLDEVKGDIEKQLVDEKARQTAQTTAGFTAKLIKGIAAKGSFASAAAAFHLKTQTPPAFVPNSVQNDPKVGPLAYQAFQLKVNDVSAPFAMPGGDTYAILHVDSRGTPDPAAFSDFDKRFREQEDQSLRTVATADWVDWKSKQAGTHRPPDLDAYGGVE